MSGVSMKFFYPYSARSYFWRATLFFVIFIQWRAEADPTMNCPEADYQQVDSEYQESTDYSPVHSDPEFPDPLTDLIDLEATAQHFVLETRKIDIPQFPRAFNPSIVRWMGSYLLSFRIRDPGTCAAPQIGLVWLDDDFQIRSKPQILKFSSPDPCAINKRQDPRLVVIDRQLMIIYNNVIRAPSTPEIRRMVYAEIHLDGHQFYATKPQTILYFEKENPQRSEKNWVPFDYQGFLMLGRSICPHEVLHSSFATDRFQTRSWSSQDVQWDWGVIRGGTPALLVDNEYLAFFHSSINMQTVHSRGKSIQHYFMGAYTFSAHPPFELTRISPQPIVGKNFYKGMQYPTWKPLCVVFPGGFVFDDQYIWIAYGRQDHEIWVVKLDKKELLNYLVDLPRFER
jgi:predicted GH43/DUF377 family glycosyl hydrolase